MSIIVALDLETTGLESKSDAIIEIGAVKFDENGIIDEWTSLINPNRPISSFITNLTGISNDMVADAPEIHEVVDEFQTFVGVHPILGQNIQFDLGFLKAVGLFHNNISLDTYDIAAVMLPNASRYNLGALGKALDINLPANHRALDDTKVTHAVYVELFKKAKKLPIELVAEIVRLGEKTPWGGHFLFKELLKNTGQKIIPTGRTIKTGPIYETPPPKEVVPLTPNEDIKSLDIEEVSSLLERGGELSKIIPNFEHRPEQVELCRAISMALTENQHLLAEAGTGTGKSIAYLIPAAKWALQNNTRVVISTNTINLQDQLIIKDIPTVQKLMGSEFSSSVLKGRANYLCPRRLEALRTKGPETVSEIRTLVKTMIWLTTTETGDVNEINIANPADRSVWNQISARDEGCSTEMCIKRMGGICPLHRARQAAQESHILIINHALLLADIATGNRLLPDYEYLIIDEGHHLESATTSTLSFRITQNEIDRTLKELGSIKSGVLGRTLVLTRSLLEPGSYAPFENLVRQTTDKAILFQSQIKSFFSTIYQFLEEQRGGKPFGNYAHQERIINATRMQPAWLNVEVSWEQTDRAIKAFIQDLDSIGKALGELQEIGAENIEDTHTNVTNLRRRFTEFYTLINGLVFEPDNDMIYWISLDPRWRRITLEAAPLHIGTLMEKHLWHEKSSIIVTSATLATDGNFEYLKNRLNAWDADDISFGSPFDYENSTLLYIPDNIPEPSDKYGHQKAVNRGLTDLATSIGGRTLALFTSYAQLKTTSQAISKHLQKQGIEVFEQGSGASAHSLVEAFKNSDKAILLGTRSFWEGVDIPGDTLSALALIKIPFAVPSDPIVAARGETFDQPFYQYSIPEAILTFRQGFGRLIRHQQDRGIVAIFDKRVISKQYGQMFINSLPQCTLRAGPIENIGKEAEKWLGI
jgi:ATP-dependent DNA helicase DinG